MSFTFVPLTEEEINAANLLPDGEYDFEVIAAKDKLSKSGNTMIELQLKVWDNAGREHIIFDYLLLSLMYKVKHFCDAVGLIESYKAGLIKDHECVAKIGKAKIIIQKGKDGYPDKNSVKDYLASKNEEPKKTDNFVSDDIPF